MIAPTYLYERWNSPVVHGNIVDRIDCIFASNPKNFEHLGNRMQLIHHMMLHGY